MTKYTLFFCIITFSLSSCCKKTACVENHNISVTFYGFTKAEVDTVYTTGYDIGSDFAQITMEQKLDTAAHFPSLPDSVFLLVMRTQSSTSAFGNVVIPPDDTHEWKIHIPAVNRTILIHNYGYTTYRCNGCGLRRGEKVNSLSTCSVDDSTKHVNNIKIYK